MRWFKRHASETFDVEAAAQLLLVLLIEERGKTAELRDVLGKVHKQNLDLVELLHSMQRGDDGGTVH